MGADIAGLYRSAEAGIAVIPAANAAANAILVIFFNSYNVGYVPPTKVNNFKFNLPIMKAIEIKSIDTVKDNKKSLYVKMVLSEKHRRERVEEFKLLSSKSIWQQNLSAIKIGDRVFFKIIEPEKIIFYRDENLMNEIGSVPKKVLKMFQNILDYSSRDVKKGKSPLSGSVASESHSYDTDKLWNHALHTVPTIK